MKILADARPELVEGSERRAVVILEERSDEESQGGGFLPPPLWFDRLTMNGGRLFSFRQPVGWFAMTGETDLLCAPASACV